MPFMFGFNKQPLPVGVDVGSDGLRVLQLDQTGTAVRVHGAARAGWPDDIAAATPPGKTPEPAVLKPLLDRLVRQGKCVGKRIVTALPRELVRFKSVRLPVMSDDELAGAAQLEADRAFDLKGSDNHIVRWITAGEVRQGTDNKLELILLVADASDVDSFVESWHAIGYEPAAIDFEPMAIYRSLERFVRRKDDEQDVNVLLDIGARRSQILIGRGRELNFYKTIDVGGRSLTQTIAHKLAITEAEARTLRERLAATSLPVEMLAGDPVREAVYDTLRPAIETLAREVSLCLRYYSVNFRGRRPLRVRLVGGEAGDPIISQILGLLLPVPIETAVPLINADMSGMKMLDRTSAAPAWTTAFGLSLRFCTGSLPDRAGPSRTVQSPEPATKSAAVEIAAPSDKPADVVELPGPKSAAVPASEVLSA
jgi:type IV pilus assembly protein PilM